MSALIRGLIGLLVTYAVIRAGVALSGATGVVAVALGVVGMVAVVVSFVGELIPERR